MSIIKIFFILISIFNNIYCLPLSLQSFHLLPNLYYKNNIINRIVIIADIHSDYNRFNEILQNADILDSNNKWIAQKYTLVIQLGDQIDRKSIDKDDITDKHHFALTYYTDYLKKEARKYDSDVISIIGNHELMNIEKIKEKKIIRNIIAYRPIIFNFYKYIFCHGGFTKAHYDFLQEFNMSIYDINIIWKKYVMDMVLSSIETKALNYLILNTTDSILYIRKNLDTKELLKDLDIEYMFVGHNETDHIHLKNKVWYLDQMLKTSFDNKDYNYIEIINDTIYIRNLDYKKST